MKQIALPDNMSEEQRTWLERSAAAIKLHAEDPEAYRALLDEELRLWFHPSDLLMLRHPYVYAYGAEPPDTINDRYRGKTEMIAKAIVAQRWGEVLVWYERPWRLGVLRWLRVNSGRTAIPIGSHAPVFVAHLPHEQYQKLLVGAWQDTEIPSQEARTVHLSMFRYAGWVSDELAPQPDLPVRLWRGVQHTKFARGLSWTADLTIARWFAARFRRGGYVYECIVPPDRLMAAIVGRGEAEYVVNTLRWPDMPIRLVETIPAGTEVRR